MISFSLKLKSKSFSSNCVVKCNNKMQTLQLSRKKCAKSVENVMPWFSLHVKWPSVLFNDVKQHCGLRNTVETLEIENKTLWLSSLFESKRTSCLLEITFRKRTGFVIIRSDLIVSLITQALVYVISWCPAAKGISIGGISIKANKMWWC